MNPANLAVVEIKAFVPARDFALSMEFYEALGFTRASVFDDIAYFHCGASSFLLQDFFVQEHAANYQMHLNASVSGVARSMIASRRSFGIVMIVSTQSRSASMSTSASRKIKPGACGTSRSSTRVALCGELHRIFEFSLHTT